MLTVAGGIILAAVLLSIGGLVLVVGLGIVYRIAEYLPGRHGLQWAIVLTLCAALYLIFGHNGL